VIPSSLALPLVGALQGSFDQRHRVLLAARRRTTARLLLARLAQGGSGNPLVDSLPPDTVRRPLATVKVDSSVTNASIDVDLGPRFLRAVSGAGVTARAMPLATTVGRS